MPDPVVEVSDLWFWYAEGEPVLRGVDLTVAWGEFTALAGANGSGKTTLVKHFNGLLRPGRGEIRIAGRPTAGCPVGELAAQVGFLFQHPEQQIFCPTVREEIAFGPRNLGLAPAQIEARVNTALVRFGLGAVADQPPAVLGYGLRRRITLASLAAMEPPILVLDEPTVGLDAAGRYETLAWLKESQSRGCTVLLVTHDMGLAAEFAGRMIVLRAGQIIADGAPGVLFQRADFLAAASLAPPPVFVLSQALRPLGMRGGSLTPQAFSDEYVALVQGTHGRAAPSPGQDETGVVETPDKQDSPAATVSPLGSPSGFTHAGQSPGAIARPRSTGVDLYVLRDSWLHRMDPRAKLWAVVLAAVVAMMYRQSLVLAAFLLIAHLAILSAHVPLARVRWFWARLAPLLLMILILQPWFSPGSGDPLLQLGPLSLTWEGIADGVSFVLRTAALAFIVAVLLLTTAPTDLVQGLVRLGLPYPWGLTVGLSLRFLPTTFAFFSTISEAQQARGWMASQGNFLARARSYLPVMVATVIAALRLGDRLGLALAARGLGYPAPRTLLHRLHFRPADWLAVVLASAVFVTMLALRYALGFGALAW